MTETTNIRLERIEKLLHELRYEVERGLHNREIDEHMTFQFIYPISQKIPNGSVVCRFEVRPMPMGRFMLEDREPRLKVVK